MNYGDLKQELADRGFAHIPETRRGRYINGARAELDRLYFWPWREASATGTTPLTVPDLGPIEAVVNTSQSSYPLQHADYRSLLDAYSDLSVSGTPQFYYVARPSGDPVLATVPTSGSDLIGVQYWKVTADLVDDIDTPDSPDEAHYLIVDLAARQAYNDNDEFFSASMVQQEAERKLDQLLTQYAPGVQDGPDAYVGFTGASEDS